MTPRGAHNDIQIERMASGHLALILQEGAEWSGLDAFAGAFLPLVGGQILRKADSPVDRVWTVRIEGAEFWLAFDDLHARYELNARSAAGDAVIMRLAHRLADSAGGH